MTAAISSGNASLKNRQDRVQIVLDTSALVSDPDALEAFPGCDVVVPLTVVEELDGLKSRNDEVGWLARTALRALEAARVRAGGSLVGPVPVGDSSTLRVEINGINRLILTSHGLDPDKADNRIIGAALGLSSSSAVVRVVSNDAAFRVKAAHLGLEAVEHQPVSTDQAGPGWIQLDVDSSVIDSVYGQKSFSRGDLPDEISTVIPPGNSFAVLRAGSSSALIRSRGHQLETLSTRPPTAWGLKPRSVEQRLALELLLDPTVPVVALDGPAGCGKSLLAIAAGLELTVEQSKFERLRVFKPLVPVGREEVGFLPGDLREKTGPYFAAFYDAVTALTERRSATDAEKVVEALVVKGQLSLEPVTFLRGRSIASSWIIVDEATNLERAVLKTLLTRVSEGTKIVFTGDVSQIDHPFASAHNNALTALIESFGGNELFGHIRLTSCERSKVASLAATLL